MTTSLDRKLACCAREIAAAKPKGLSFAEFEAGVHWPNGWTVSIDLVAGVDMSVTFEHAFSQEKAAPPVAKFQVGDLVRLSAEVVRLGRLSKQFNTPFVIARIVDGKCYFSDGSYAGIDQIELIPSEPKAGEWITKKGDSMPADFLAANTTKWYGSPTVPAGSLRPANTQPELGRMVLHVAAMIIAYRVIA